MIARWRELAMRASRLAKYQSERDTPTHRHGMGLPLSPHQPFDDSQHAALSNQQQQDNGGQHDLDASEPIARLLPSFGADGLMHGQAGGGFLLAHGSSPVMLLVPAGARGSARVHAVPTAARWATSPARNWGRVVSSPNPIAAWSVRWQNGRTKMRWRFTTPPDEPLGSSLWRPAARPIGRRSPACRRR